MGLLEQEIKELRELRKQLIEGKTTPEMGMMLLGVYSQTEKRAKMILQAHAIAAKHGKATFNRMSKANFISDGDPMELGVDYAEEKIRCPDLEQMITREQCLDLSGEACRHQDCTSCTHYPRTRELLLPEDAV